MSVAPSSYIQCCESDGERERENDRESDGEKDRDRQIECGREREKECGRPDTEKGEERERKGKRKLGHMQRLALRIEGRGVG